MIQVHMYDVYRINCIQNLTEKYIKRDKRKINVQQTINIIRILARL